MSPDEKVACSFCGKTRKSVEKLIAGPNVYICNECIVLSYAIVAKKEQEQEQEETELPPLPTPSEIKDHLDEYIIGHAATKELLSVSVYNHYKRIYLASLDKEVEKSNILLIGQTGTGKTLFAKTLAKKMDVPFAIADATTLTEAGYVGEDVESVLERLLAVADYDVEKAQNGIVYIDEIDKKARKGESNTQTTKDVSGEGVQQALLRLIEGTTVKIRVNSTSNRGYAPEEFVEFDTTNILFILGGAFVGLEKIIEKRQAHGTSIGFTADIMTKDRKESLLRYANHHDITVYGIIPELVGRLPLIGALDPLDKDVLVDIMTSVKNNIFDQTKELLALDGLDISFGTEFIETAAELAIEMKLGARALRTIVDQATLSIMYRAPDLHKSGVQKVVFNKYPSAEGDYPLLEFDNEDDLILDTNYTLYRG